MSDLPNLIVAFNNANSKKNIVNIVPHLFLAYEFWQFIRMSCSHPAEHWFAYLFTIHLPMNIKFTSNNICSYIVKNILMLYIVYIFCCCSYLEWQMYALRPTPYGEQSNYLFNRNFWVCFRISTDWTWKKIIAHPIFSVYHMHGKCIHTPSI